MSSGHARSNPERKLAAMELAERARTASRVLLASSGEQRARALRLYADELESRKVAEAIAVAGAGSAK